MPPDHAVRHERLGGGRNRWRAGLRRLMQKSVYVRELFASIAPRYDRANRIMTAGIDERWRRKAVRVLAPPRGGRETDA